MYKLAVGGGYLLVFMAAIYAMAYLELWLMNKGILRDTREMYNGKP